MFFSDPRFSCSYFDSRKDRFDNYQEEGLTKQEAKEMIGEWHRYSIVHGLVGMGSNRIAVGMFHAGVHTITSVFEIGMGVVDPRTESYQRMQVQLTKHEQAMGSDSGISVSGQRLFVFVHACIPSPLPLCAQRLPSCWHRFSREWEECLLPHASVRRYRFFFRLAAVVVRIESWRRVSRNDGLRLLVCAQLLWWLMGDASRRLGGKNGLENMRRGRGNQNKNLVSDEEEFIAADAFLIESSHLRCGSKGGVSIRGAWGCMGHTCVQQGRLAGRARRARGRAHPDCPHGDRGRLRG